MLALTIVAALSFLGGIAITCLCAGESLDKAYKRGFRSGFLAANDFINGDGALPPMFLEGPPD